MKNKINTSYSIDEYNKKYSNRRYRLLKFSKKEVEEFDIQHGHYNYDKKRYDLKDDHYLLKGRNWCLIKDTYYEIPKPIRLTWFRNLNTGIQLGCCLLGVGVVASAITVPLVLLNQNKVIEPKINITGADYDIEASHIELHKESTIVLKKTDKEITGIEYVKVGGNQLNDNQYSFDKDSKKLTIKAEAMTSTKIEIKVKAEEPTTVVTKDEWFAIADKWYGDFNKSRTEYTSSKIKFIYNNKQSDFKTLVYDKDDNGQRFAKISLDNEKYGITGYYIASSDDTKEGYFYKKLKSHDTEGVKYTITNDELIYIDDKAEKEDVCEFRINKDGYITKEVDKIGELETDVESFEFVYNGEQKLYYNIDWNKTAFDLKRDGAKKTLWNFAKEATKIEFIKDETIGDVCVGKTIGESTERDPIYASYITKDADEILTIWSKEKISFVDDDRIAKQQGFFYGCKKVASINFINIDTHKVTNFNNTFVNCDLLKDANFKYFDTSNAVDMNNMFYFTQFEHLDLSSFNTSNVTNMNSMFANSFNLKTIDLSSFNTSNVKNMGYMFQMDIAQGTSQLETIYASNKFNTDNVTNSTGMFTSCQKLVGGKGTAYNSSKLDKSYARIDQGPKSSVPGYFTDIAQKFHNIDWATKKVDGTNTLYDLAKNATSIEFMQSDSTDGTLCGETDNDLIYYAFTNNALKIWSKYKIAFNDKDLRTDSSAYGGPVAMFYNCKSTTLIDLTNIDTSKLTNMRYLFGNCENLNELKHLDELNTSNVTSMSAMFLMVGKLTTIDVSTFDTSKVTDMSGMFIGSANPNNEKLVEIRGLTNFDTSKVINYLNMFQYRSKLTTIDLSSFKIASGVHGVNCMFMNCSSLTTIYCNKDFDLSKASGDSDYMFSGCSSLVGGKGTSFSGLDKTYAHVDGGSSNPGYFTEVGELSFDSSTQQYMYFKAPLKKLNSKYKLTIIESHSVKEIYMSDNSGNSIEIESGWKVLINGKDSTDLFEYDASNKNIKLKNQSEPISEAGTVIEFELKVSSERTSGYAIAY